ncbi:MAG: DUF2007 domain-containing protein [Emcibacteraceae bacterium]|nr:DUF2007 domain-containing protein [Emcibacteraceae bacterium]
MKDLLFTSNPVIISRISAILEAEDIQYVVLGGVASLFGGDYAGISTRMMVEENCHEEAIRLIRECHLENDVELKL